MEQDILAGGPRAVSLVAHADWGSHPRKRWLAVARSSADGEYVAEAPVLAGEPASLLERLAGMAGGGAIMAGFDFPFGVPGAYARRAGIDDFLEVFPQFGHGRWERFYDVAETPEQIELERPFYPRRPGAARQQHLLDGLGLTRIGELRRRCDHAHSSRRAGSPLFWTLGAQQVGKAAISGWRDVVMPAMAHGLDVAIWPFHGTLAETLTPGRVVVAETYPGECYDHLGIRFGRGGKRAQRARAAAAPALQRWADLAGVRLTPALQRAIDDGFGASPDGEDPFDSTVGLFGTLNVVLGLRAAGEPHPDDRVVRRIEGWILGQRYNWPGDPA